VSQKTAGSYMLDYAYRLTDFDENKQLDENNKPTFN
jgi:hypothetical protein